MGELVDGYGGGGELAVQGGESGGFAFFCGSELWAAFGDDEGVDGELAGFEVDFEFEAVGEEGLLHEGDLFALLRGRHLLHGGELGVVDLGLDFVLVDVLAEPFGAADDASVRSRGVGCRRM